MFSVVYLCAVFAPETGEMAVEPGLDLVCRCNNLLGPTIAILSASVRFIHRQEIYWKHALPFGCRH